MLETSILCQEAINESFFPKLHLVTKQEETVENAVQVYNRLPVVLFSHKVSLIIWQQVYFSPEVPRLSWDQLLVWNKTRSPQFKNVLIGSITKKDDEPVAVPCSSVSPSDSLLTRHHRFSVIHVLLFEFQPCSSNPCELKAQDSDSLKHPWYDHLRYTALDVSTKTPPTPCVRQSGTDGWIKHEPSKTYFEPLIMKGFLQPPFIGQEGCCSFLC